MIFNEVFKPKFCQAIYTPDPLAALIEEPCPGVFVFDAFTKEFCNLLLTETDKHKSVAPNSMNKYGVVLEDIGLGNVCEFLLKRLVNPLARRFYPHGGRLTQYHGFIVNYEPGKQKSLDLHYDDSDVTLNVCLGRKFTGGKLLFHSEEGVAKIEHKVGQAVIHLGEHRHQAQNIQTGKRSNLILWCSSGRQ
jgi:hypothetical protein